MINDKTSLRQESEKLSSISPELANILEDILKNRGLPDKELIKVEFNFGDMLLSDGRLTVSNCQDIAFGVVLEHSLEVFTHDQNKITPMAILEAGQAFVLMDHPGLSLLPLSLLNICAGARSIFLLPKITEEMRFWKLAQNCNLEQKDPPQNLNEHWQIFSDIAGKARSPWRATVLLFDKSWLDYHSLAGHKLYQYLQHTNLPNAHFFRKKLTFEMAFADTLSELGFKADPSFIRSINHLFEISCHFLPGFVFAEDESLAPIKLLQDAFMKHYGLRYTPTILQPGYAKPGRRCYHPMQNPMLNHNSPRKHETNLEQIREIYRVVHKTIEHIQEIDPISRELVEFLNAELEFFHVNAQEKHREVEPSKNIGIRDPVIQRQVAQFHIPFSDASAFLRKGCIAMSTPQTS